MSLQNYEKKRNMLAFPFGKVVENSLNYEIEDFFSRSEEHTSELQSH